MTRRIAPPSELEPPCWVAGLLHPRRALREHAESRYRLTTQLGGDWALLSVRRPDARELAGDQFAAAAERCYHLLRQGLAAPDCAGLRPLRMWNGVPGILERDAEGLNRYMHFNAGRHAACRAWLDDGELPTASGVGHAGDDLLVHCLAGRHPARAIENPRQVSAYRYSRRYGPKPPCFARATRVATPAGPLLLIGGTASVLGEDSAHPGDLQAQLAETLRNIDALCAAAGEGGLRPRELRIYHPRAGDRDALDAALDAAGVAPEREWLCTALCRDELLVEIEALAGPEAR